jgi:penicillin-binding protein 1A
MSPRKSRRSSKKKRSSFRKFLFFLLSIVGLFVLCIGIWTISAALKTPSWDPAALSDPKQSSRIYDKDGNIIAQLNAGENRLTAQSVDIPDIVKQTFVAVEDKRFYSHFGVDPIRIAGSGVHNILSRSKNEGASTITMQLAKNAFISNPTSKTFTRKIQEAILAMQLEHKYSKDEILTFYLNKIYFGESSYGIRAAAQIYFDRENLADLTPDEVALLVGLPQAPSWYDPYMKPEDAKDRRTIVLGVMRDAGIISAADYTSLNDAPFSYIDQVKEASGGAQKTVSAAVGYQFPYYVDYVIDQLESIYNLSEDQIFSGGLQIYTTVDPQIQKAAETAFANNNNFPQSVDDVKVQAAITLLDPATGAVRAMVGGRDYTPRGLNRAWYTRRQPGSTIKPLVVYAPALEKGGYFPGTVLDDMPVQYNAGNGQVWAPVDFDTETSGWKGLITMRYAVENSVNVYAVKLMSLIGVEYGWSFGKEKLGLPLASTERNNLTLALGSTHVSTLEMASAYGAFANNGVRVTPHAVEKVLDSHGSEVITPAIIKERVMKETTAYLMNSLLRSVVTSGTGISAQIGNWYVCGKTGTTSLDPAIYGNKSGNPDAWFAGYTPNYVGVVWMGYDSDDDRNHYLRNVYGGSYPTQIWKQVMTAALQGKETISSIAQPVGIVSGEFDRKSGLLPSDLTPAQFVASEIAAQGSFPAMVSQVWITKEIDSENPAFLAGPSTNISVTKTFLNIPGRSASTSWPQDELAYKPPTEYAAAAPSTTPDTASPNVDPDLPIPSLGSVSYDAAAGEASLLVSAPASTKDYTIIIYLKRPDSQIIETIRTTIKTTGTTTSCPLKLTDHGEISPGKYTFWVALRDPAAASVGSPSNGATLTIE